MFKQPHHFGILGSIPSALIVVAMLASICGCSNDAIEANQRQVQENQKLIEQSQLEIARLQANQSAGPSAAPVPTGTCDKKVEATATRRAGEAYAAGNSSKALGYYKDALTACPTSARAAMNVARTYEGMNDRAAAIRYYRQAAASSDSDAKNIDDAKAALSRLGAKSTPPSIE